MNYKIKVPKITDKTYYTLSQESYNRERLADKMKTGKPIQTDQKTYWYVEKIKTDEDTG
ncbi:lipase, partial [Bacillus sp. EKM417B]